MFPVSHGESQNTDRTGFFKDAVVERKRLLVEFRGFPRVFFSAAFDSFESFFFHLFFFCFVFKGLLASSGSRAAESQQPSGSDGEGTEGEELSELG